MNDPLFQNKKHNDLPFVNSKLKSLESSKETDPSFFIRATFEENPSKGLELLFRQYYGPLCSHAARFVYSKQVAEDLVSEVFFQFYRTKSYKKITTSFNHYLFRSVRNECYTYIKREFNKTDAINVTDENCISSKEQQPDAEIHYNNLSRKINETIDELPAQCQRVFLMSRFENMKYHEIAQELNISPKTVEVHVSKALKYLRNALSGEWLLTGIMVLLSWL
jgi:RNA polymerase sigma-70 factor (family 1)